MWKPLSLSKKQHDHNNTCEETMGQKEGMESEQVIACTCELNMLCASLRFMPDTCLPCASPYQLQHHRMPALPSAGSLWQNQKNRRATITPRGIPGVERLSAHSQ
jgi:hypothetical protein